MSPEKIAEIVQGVAVVVDDRVNTPEAGLSDILAQLTAAGLPLLLLEELPPVETLVHWRQFGLIILDWELFGGDEGEDDEDKVVLPVGTIIPDELKQGSAAEVTDFVTQLLTVTSLPVFIASNVAPEAIREYLHSNIGHLEGILEQRVAVFSKAELATSLFDQIDQQIRQNPSLAVLRAWNRAYVAAEVSTFNHFVGDGDDWVAAVKMSTVRDQVSTGEAIREVVSRNILNRINHLDHKLDDISSDGLVDASKLRRVVHLSAVMPNDALEHGKLGTGDLFVLDGASKPYEEIRILLTPDCDLPRRSKVRMTYLTARKLSGHTAKTSAARVKKVNNPPLGSVISCVLTENGDEYEIKLGEWDSMWITARGFEMNADGLATIPTVEVVGDHESTESGSGPVPPAWQEGDGYHLEWAGFVRVGRLMEPYLSNLQQAFAAVVVRKGLPALHPDFFK